MRRARRKSLISALCDSTAQPLKVQVGSEVKKTLSSNKADVDPWERRQSSPGQQGQSRSERTEKLQNAMLKMHWDERREREEKEKRYQRLDEEDARICAEKQEREQRRLQEIRDFERLQQEERERELEAFEEGALERQQLFHERQLAQLRATVAQRDRTLRTFLDIHGFGGPNEKKVNRSNPKGSTYAYPLHIAVQVKDTAAVEALMLAGADATRRDSNGSTPWQLAQSLDYHGSHQAVIAMLQTCRPSS